MIDHDSENAVSKSIVVEVDVAKAFRLWTEQIRVWWPVSHSRSGDPRTKVFIEGKVGGRFYECASDGVEYNWGAVDVWDPPDRLAFTWYLGSSWEHPTRVEVHFVAMAENKTRVEITHRGPELIGVLWGQRKHVFSAAWDSVLSKFEAFAA